MYHLTVEGDVVKTLLLMVVRSNVLVEDATSLLAAKMIAGARRQSGCRGYGSGGGVAVRKEKHQLATLGFFKTRNF